MKTITIGSLTISRQSFIIAVSGIIAGIILMIVLPGAAKVTGLFTILVFFMASYNVNCTLVGHCNTWAWILTFGAILNAIMYIVVFVGVATRKKSSPLYSPNASAKTASSKK
jgi:hypothetical protein